MLPGIIACQNKFPKLLMRAFHFLPIALTALYLIIIAAILVPLAVAICVVLVPLAWVLWRAKENRFNPTFLRIMYPFELIGLIIVNAPEISKSIVARTRTIRIRRPTLKAPKLEPIHFETVRRSKAAMLSLRILAILGLLGVAVYLVMVAAVVVPLAIAACLLLAPLSYLVWYLKEKKFIPLFHKIPAYLEHLGFSIVNSRKIFTDLLLGMKGMKWPML